MVSWVSPLMTNRIEISSRAGEISQKHSSSTLSGFGCPLISQMKFRTLFKGSEQPWPNWAGCCWLNQHVSAKADGIGINFTLFFKLKKSLILFMCMAYEVKVHVSWHTCGGQRTLWWTQFFLSIMWVPGIELRSSASVAGAFACWAVS